jgi:hypothetical protein
MRDKWPKKLRFERKLDCYTLALEGYIPERGFPPPRCDCCVFVMSKICNLGDHLIRHTAHSAACLSWLRTLDKACNILWHNTNSLDLVTPRWPRPRTIRDTIPDLLYNFIQIDRRCDAWPILPIRHFGSRRFLRDTSKISAFEPEILPFLPFYFIL